MPVYRFLSWNVNGLRAALKKGFEDFFQKETFDILSIQESKLNEKTLPEEWKSPQGYHSYWNFAERKGYSGVATFSKKEPLSVKMGLGIEEHDQEGRIITLEFDKFYHITSYTPNSGQELVRLDYRQIWDRDFLGYCKDLEKKKPVIICGDLNVAHTDIDLANPKSNYNKTAGYTQAEIDGLNNLLGAGFIDTFREFEKEGGHYTWWSYRFSARAKNIGWRLDYFLISQSLRKGLKKSWIEKDILGSDHCPVGVEMEV